MSNVIIRDFKFSRDFRSIDWGGTIKYNLLRAFCAGIVWSIIMLFMDGPAKHDKGFVFGFPFMLPIGYFVFFLPLGIVAAKLSSHVPFVGWFALIAAVLIVVGDPLVFVLSLFAPRFVGADKPGFVNFVLVIWLLKNENVVADVVVSDERKINRL